jgi:hypothetical protein
VHTYAIANSRPREVHTSTAASGRKEEAEMTVQGGVGAGEEGEVTPTS